MGIDMREFRNMFKYMLQTVMRNPKENSIIHPTPSKFSLSAESSLPAILASYIQHPVSPIP